MASNIALKQTVSGTAQAIAAGGSSVISLPVPQDARVKRYWAISSVDEAAHATQVLSVTVVNKGLAGADSTTLAVLTNDTDLPDSTTRKSSAWVADDIKEINTEARPVSAYATDVADYVAGGSVLEFTVAKASGTTTGNVMVGYDYVPST